MILLQQRYSLTLINNNQVDNKFGTSLIDCIKQFELGQITISNTTSKKIYLSNGESFNQHLWYQSKNIYNYIMKDLVSGSDSSVAENLKYRENLKIKNLEIQLTMKREQLAKDIADTDILRQKYDDVKNELTYHLTTDLVHIGDELFNTMTDKFPYGKFAGQRICDVYKTDANYVRWMFNNVDKYKQMDRFPNPTSSEVVIVDDDLPF